MSTECVTIIDPQILNPVGTTVDSTGNRPLEDGITPLVPGQAYVDVVFIAPHENYNYDQLVVENFTDNPPLCIVLGPVVYEDDFGFRVMFNSAPDSLFYQLRWRITV